MKLMLHTRGSKGCPHLCFQLREPPLEGSGGGGRQQRSSGQPQLHEKPCAQADAKPQSRLCILSPLSTTKGLVPKGLKAHNSVKSLWNSLVPFDVISFIKPKLRPGHYFLDDSHVKYCNHHLCSSTDYLEISKMIL